MNNSIQDMRDRLTKRFSGVAKPIEGVKITQFRPTANNAPRLPQSTIPSPKVRYDKVGRPAKAEGRLPENIPLERKKPRDIWGGWL